MSGFDVNICKLSDFDRKETITITNFVFKTDVIYFILANDSHTLRSVIKTKF